MDDDSSVQISAELMVPLAELGFRASRASGPGGQHVNKTSSRVELVWSVRHSPSLGEAQRERLLRRLANRINAAGELVLAEQGSRSQHRNREVVIERFRALLAEALVVPKVRRKSKPSRGAREQRLGEKKRRATIKRLRGSKDVDG
jgi:ribosome-associated protein